MKGTATIEKIVSGGWGLAHHEGRTVFIQYAAAGDVVEFSITKEKKKCLFGRIDRIVEPSKLRSRPDCPVFTVCGGCHMQHMSYEDELNIKKEILLENLHRIGKIRTTLDSAIPSPDRFGYRNHTVFNVDGEGRAGFLESGSSSVVPFPEGGCRLLPTQMRESIEALPPDELPPGGEVRVRMDRFGAVHFWGLAGKPGPPDCLMEAGGFLFPVSPASFFQTNRLLNDRLIDLVLSMQPKVGRKLLDLYCGSGFFTLPLSKLAIEAVGIERDPGAVANATASLRLNKISNVRFRKGPVEREIYRMKDIDRILADPPRSGIPEKAIRGMLRLKPRELILVSCDPPTFARDAARFIESGYLLSQIHMIDMFPGTYHMEAAALFKKN